MFKSNSFEKELQDSMEKELLKNNKQSSSKAIVKSASKNEEQSANDNPFGMVASKRRSVAAVSNHETNYLDLISTASGLHGNQDLSFSLDPIIPTSEEAEELGLTEYGYDENPEDFRNPENIRLEDAEIELEDAKDELKNLKDRQDRIEEDYELAIQDGMDEIDVESNKKIYTQYLLERNKLNKKIEELSTIIDKMKSQKNYMEHSPAEWEKSVNPDTVSQEDIHIQSPLAYDAFEEEDDDLKGLIDSGDLFKADDALENDVLNVDINLESDHNLDANFTSYKEDWEDT